MVIALMNPSKVKKIQKNGFGLQLSATLGEYVFQRHGMDISILMMFIPINSR